MRGTAVVTGAGRGLGAAIVERLSQQGFEVLATDISGTDVVLDVTDPAACRELALATDPVVWVNNAGVLGAGDAATQPEAIVQQVVTTNLLGSIYGTRAAVAVMRDRAGGRGSGHIINVASLASWVPVPGETVYAAAKAGLLSYTLGLKAELRAQGVTGIHLSVVCPDGMLTPMITEELQNPHIALSFSGMRTLEPAEVAQRVADLIDRPRTVSSVPHWRGAMVRVLGAVPEHSLKLSSLFTQVGARNQRKAQRGAGSTRQGADQGLRISYPADSRSAATAASSPAAAAPRTGG